MRMKFSVRKGLLTMDVVFELINHELLITDYAFAALTRFVRFLARARAAPSASGFDPAAPARSYRVGSGTTRSKPLAEGIMTALAPDCASTNSFSGRC